MIELTKCRAGFYYYFTATAQYILKKEGNQWAFYKTVKGEIDGKALIVARTLTLLKESLINFVDSEIDTQDNEPKIEPQSHNQETTEATVTSEVEPVDFEIDSDLLNSEQNDHSSEQNDQDLANEAIKAVIQAGEEYLKHLIANENSEQNEPDGDDLHYPPEIDSPDPDFDHDSPEIDYPDYSLMVAQVKKDIAEGEFIHKIPHYLKLLQVTREQFDDFVIPDVDFSIDNEEWDEEFYDISYEIDEKAVLNRLSQLYRKDDYQALLDKFKEDNPHFTILESKFFTVPYWHLKESKVMIFGYGGDGDKWGIFSVISFTKDRTNHIYDGCYEQCRIVYREYCEEVGKFSFASEPPKDPILEAYKQELSSDGRLITRKQLALF